VSWSVKAQTVSFFSKAYLAESDGERIPSDAEE